MPTRPKAEASGTGCLRTRLDGPGGGHDPDASLWSTAAPWPRINARLARETIRSAGRRAPARSPRRGCCRDAAEPPPDPEPRGAVAWRPLLQGGARRRRTSSAQPPEDPADPTSAPTPSSGSSRGRARSPGSPRRSPHDARQCASDAPGRSSRTHPGHRPRAQRLAGETPGRSEPCRAAVSAQCGRRRHLGPGRAPEGPRTISPVRRDWSGWPEGPPTARRYAGDTRASRRWHRPEPWPSGPLVRFPLAKGPSAASEAQASTHLRAGEASPATDLDDNAPRRGGCGFLCTESAMTHRRRTDCPQSCAQQAGSPDAQLPGCAMARQGPGRSLLQMRPSTTGAMPAGPAAASARITRSRRLGTGRWIFTRRSGVNMV